jgi:hypothetical protein
MRFTVQNPAVTVSIEIRRELARLAASRRTRRTVFSPDAPCDWRPQQVRDPRSGVYFTEIGAWEFVVELITNGHPIEVVILQRPTGKKGYVLIAESCNESLEIYMKLQLGSGFVYDRSFHPSDKNYSWLSSPGGAKQ